jgi:lipopolysaccharide export system permease protein
MIENKVPILDIANYYHFTIYFANLFPIFLFYRLSGLPQKLANNTEIIAILSSGISFTRFFEIYILGFAYFSFVLIMGFYVVPASSEGFNNFRYTYLKGGGQEQMQVVIL